MHFTGSRSPRGRQRCALDLLRRCLNLGASRLICGRWPGSNKFAMVYSANECVTVQGAGARCEWAGCVRCGTINGISVGVYPAFAPASARSLMSASATDVIVIAIAHYSRRDHVAIVIVLVMAAATIAAVATRVAAMCQASPQLRRCCLSTSMRCAIGVNRCKITKSAVNLNACDHRGCSVHVTGARLAMHGDSGRCAILPSSHVLHRCSCNIAAAVTLLRWVIRMLCEFGKRKGTRPCACLIECVHAAMMLTTSWHRMLSHMRSLLNTRGNARASLMLDARVMLEFTMGMSCGQRHFVTSLQREPMLVVSCEPWLNS